MNSIDKIFRIGLLLLGFGFLNVYAHHLNKSSTYSNPSASPRYVVNVGGVGNLHMVYLVDTQEGTVYYAQSTADTLLNDKPLKWKVSNPKNELQK